MSHAPNSNGMLPWPKRADLPRRGPRTFVYNFCPKYLSTYSAFIVSKMLSTFTFFVLFLLTFCPLLSTFLDFVHLFYVFSSFDHLENPPGNRLKCEQKIMLQTYFWDCQNSYASKSFLVFQKIKTTSSSETDFRYFRWGGGAFTWGGAAARRLN